MKNNDIMPYEHKIIKIVESLGPPVVHVFGRIDDIHITEQGGMSVIKRLMTVCRALKVALIIEVRIATLSFKFHPTRKRVKSGSMEFMSHNAEEVLGKADLKKMDKRTPEEIALQDFQEEFMAELQTKGISEVPFTITARSVHQFFQFINTLMQMTTKDIKPRRYKIAVIFDDFHYFLQATGTPPFMGYLRDLTKYWQVDNSQYRGNLIVLVTHTQEDLDKDIRKYTTPIEIPMPTRKQRMIASTRVLKTIQSRIPIPNLDPKQVAIASAGLPTITQIVDLLWEAAVNQKKKLTNRMLQHAIIEKKKEWLMKEFGGLLIYRDPEDLPSLKKVIIDTAIRNEVIALMKVWINLVLIGPPGTGKTKFAQALANELNLPFLALSGSLKDKYVGESEKRLQKVFEIAQNFGGCILFFDEIETMFPKRGTPTGSDVTQSLQGLLFQQLDGMMKKSNIIFIGATNRPQDLDLALLRRVTPIPIFPPDYEGVMDIAIIHYEELGYKSADLGAKVTEVFSDPDIMWTGATIAKIIKRAHARVKNNKKLDIFVTTANIIKRYRFPKRAEAQAIIDACLDMIDVQDMIPERFLVKSETAPKVETQDRF